MATENLFVNVNAPTLAGSRVVSSTNNQAEPWRRFVIGDLRDLNLYFTDGAGAYVDVSGYTDFRVGVGGINDRPTGGTFVVTGGAGAETIAFDASAAAMDTAITAAQAACTVTSPVSGVWIVKFDAVGAQSLPSTDASLLTPDSTVSVKRLVTGDGSTKEEWIIRNFQVPWAYSESWSNITNGVTGGLNFGTENLHKAMGTDDSLAGYFEIELTDASANISTVVQAPVTIQGPVIGDGVAGAGAFASYLTSDVETIFCVVGDEGTALTTGAAKYTFQMPYAMTLTGIKATVGTAPTGAKVQVDVNEAASTILSTKITIDVTETSSADAAIQPVISDSALAENAIITVDIDQIGSGTAGAGLKVYLTGTRA